MSEELRTFYRCHDCKTTFEPPKNTEPLTILACPGCGKDHAAMFYIWLRGTSIENARG